MQTAHANAAFSRKGGLVKLLDVRPSGAFLGLDMYFETSGAARGHAFIAGEVLGQRFACGASPSDWLAAYQENAATIAAAVARKHRSNPGQPVIVLLADLEVESARRVLRTAGTGG